MNSARNGILFASTELAFDEFLIVEILLRQIKPARVGLFGPAGFLVRAAFRTRAGVPRHFRTATGAILRSTHLRFTIYDLRAAEQVQPISNRQSAIANHQSPSHS